MKYQKQFNFITKYSIITLLAVVAFIFMRVVEFLVFKYSLRTEPSISILFKYSIAYDALFVVLASCILLIPIAIIAKYKPRTSFIIYGSTLCIIFIINLLLSHFFVSSRYLLTAVVLEYSLKELLYIASSGISGESNPVWWLYVSILFSILLCFLANKNRFKLIEHLSFAIWLFGVVTLAFQIPQGLTKSIYSFNRRGDYYMANNKILFLGKSIVHSFNFRSKSDGNYIEAYHKSKPEFTFISNDFPLIHTEAYRNVLGDYFKPDSTPPNIVIIMAEGIGNYYAGLNSTSKQFCLLLIRWQPMDYIGKTF